MLKPVQKTLGQPLFLKFRTDLCSNRLENHCHRHSWYPCSVSKKSTNIAEQLMKFTEHLVIVKYQGLVEEFEIW